MPNEYDDLVSGRFESDNEYDDLLSIEIDSQNDSLRSSMADATKKNPDQQSKIIKLSEKTGLPNDTIERNVVEVENKTRFEANDYDELLNTNPVLSSHLSDRDFASIAHDDIDNLSFWEKTKDITRAVPGGLYQGLGAGLRGLADINDAVGRSVIRGIRALSPDIDQAYQNYLDTVNKKGFSKDIADVLIAASPSTMARNVGTAFNVTAEFISPAQERQNLATDIAAGVGQITGQIGVSALNPAVGLSFLFGQGASQQADRAVAEGATPEERDAAIFMGAAVTGVTEKIGLDKLLDRLPPAVKNNILRQFTDIAIAGGIEAAQEAIEGVLQNMIAIGVYDADGNVFDVEREALAAGGAGAIFRAIINVMIPGRMSGAEYKQQQSQQGLSNKEYVDSIGKSAKESKLRERSPKKYQKLVAEALQDSGVENVGIPADRLNEFFQENPDAFDDFNDNVEAFEEKFAEASALGEDITIPTDVLATYMGGKEYYEALSQDIRLDDSSMTAYESELFNSEAQEQLLQDYQQFEEEIATTSEDRISGDEVYDDVVKQLIDAGQTKEIAEKNALIHKAFFETMAERTGVNAFSLYQGQNLRIRGEKTTDDLDVMIDQLRAGKIPTETQARGETLTEFLRGKGGLVDEGGELSARDLGKGERFKKNLIQPEGMRLDAAIEAAREAGYIPEADPNAPDSFTANDLLELIDNEISGQPLFSEQFVDQELDVTRQQLNELSDDLQKAGLDINVMTNIEVKDFIDQVSGKEFDQPAYKEAPIIFDSIRDKFLDILPEDADFEDVLSAAEELGPNYKNLINALDRDDWLGFDFPSQAINALFSEEIENYDLSQGLKNAIGRMVNAESEGREFFQEEETSVETEAFKKWSENGEVVEPEDINDYDFDADTPVVLKVFHGTTHKFDVFDAKRGNLEGQFGAINYFTSSESDATDNYAGEGPDLTNRIERRTEKIFNEIEERDQTDTALEESRNIAREELSGGEDQTMELFVKVKNPFVIGENAAWVDFIDNTEIQEKAIEEVAGNNDITVEEVTNRSDEFKDEIDEARWDIESDTPHELVEAIQTVANRHGIEAGNIAAEVYDLGSEALPEDIEQLLRNSEDYQYAEDSETGESISSQLVAEVIEEIGFDSIILRNAESRLTNMNIESDTAHIHIFDSNKTNIKSVENVGTFGPTDPNIFNQDIPIATDDDVQNLSIELKDKYDIKTLLLNLDNNNNLNISSIIIEKGKRKKGIGTSIMNDISSFADENGLKVILTPAEKDDFQGTTSKSRLVKFYKRFGFKDNKGRNKDFTISESMIREPSELLQDEPAVPRGTKKKRGRIIFTDDSTIIDLFKDANLSTFLHESGHLFLNAFSGISQQPNAPEQMKTDMQSILEWLDVGSIEALDPANNGDAAVAAQEKWARGVESYLREGKAPSQKLQTAFQRFKSWLINVYRSARNLNVELNDEIREVMDRMLATDEEIKSAQDRNNIKSVFESTEQSGLTEEQTAKVNLANVEAIESSKEKLLVKLLKEITREKNQWWKNEKLKTRKEVESEYHQRKDYKAKTWLQSGNLPDGTELGIDHVKLSRTDLVSMYGDKAGSLWRKLPFGKNSVWTSSGGVHPDVVAGIFGFRSGDELVKSIINSGNMKTEINKETERRMLDKHGDILNDGTIESEADDAMHNVNSTEVMLSDINALNKKTGRGVSPKQVFKNIAKQIISEKKTSDIKPRSILQNERRITDRLLKAVEAGDNELSLQLANQRLINHFMYMEARDARTRVDTIQRYMTGITRRKYNPKAVDPDYINQLKLLASMYDFRKVNSEDVRKAQENIIRLVDWLSSQKENENAVYTPELISPDLARVSAIIDEAKERGQPLTTIVDKVKVTSYKDMTLGELEDVYNTARHLRFIGGKNSDDARAELREQAQGLADSIIDNAGKDVEVITDKDWADKIKEISLRFSFDQIKLLSDIRLFDGFEDFGPMFNNIYQYVVDGTNKRIKIDLDASERIKDIFMPMAKDLNPKNDIKTFKKSDGTGSWSLSTRERVMLAIYWGSPESRIALLEGHQVLEADVQKMLDTMTDTQLDFVEQIWEFNESFWPELSKIETSINGVPPVKVDHVPFTANNRELAGGYFRLYYEWSVKDKFKIDMHDEAGKMMHSNRVTQSKTGAVISRVGAGGRMVKLDPDSFFRAVEDNLQFIAFAEASREIARVAQHPIVSTAIVQKYGKDRYQSFIDSLDGVFAGDVANNNPINKMLRGVRTNLTFGYLALSVRNFVQQPVALTNAMGRIGEAETLKAVKDVYMHPQKWSKFIQEKSVFMEQRNKFVNREAAEQLASIKGNAGLGFKPKWAFVLQTLGDAFATYPTWLAAYRQGIAKFNKPGTDPEALEKMAVTYADEETASTVGSGLTKDLAPLFQGSGSVAREVGSETVKQLTFMGSFFNMTYNLYYEAWKKADFGTPKSSLNFVREMAWYAVIPGMLGALVVGSGPDDEKDEGYWEWAIKSTAEFGFSSSMFWRNMISSLNGFEPNIPAFQFFKGVSRAGKIAVDVAEGDRELDAETAAKLIRSFEPMIALPGGGQAARTLEYLDSYDQGDEGEFSLHGMLIEGKHR